MSVEIPGIALGVRLGECEGGATYAATRTADGARLWLTIVGKVDETAFEREAELGRRVAHPRAQRILGFGFLPGHAWVAEEPASGVRLDARVATDGWLASDAALTVALDLLPVAAAMVAAGPPRPGAFAPARIFVDAEMRATVSLRPVARPRIDLEKREALAEDLGHGIPAVARMSPEEVREGHALDERTLVYRLGALLFELLSGSPVVHARSRIDVVSKILRGPVPDLCAIAPQVTPILGRIVGRCLSREPGERYTLAELATTLAYLRGT